MLTCTLYKTTVQPWEEGDDEPESLTEEVSTDTYSFKELIQLIKRKGLSNRSQEPCDGSPNVWLSSDPEDVYTTGEEWHYTLHYLGGGDRYWRRATTKHFPFSRKEY
jgi:hypothetical protein